VATHLSIVCGQWQQSSTRAAIAVVKQRVTGGGDGTSSSPATIPLVGTTRANKVTAGHRAHRHGTTRLSLRSVVPGPKLRHGDTVRHDTAKLPCRMVSCAWLCRAQPSCARIVLCGLVGYVYIQWFHQISLRRAFKRGANGPSVQKKVLL